MEDNRKFIQVAAKYRSSVGRWNSAVECTSGEWYRISNESKLHAVQPGQIIMLRKVRDSNSWGYGAENNWWSIVPKSKWKE